MGFTRAVQAVIAAVIFIGMSMTAVTQTVEAGTAKSEPVKAESATNVPDGMTKEQADEILKELKAIHQLLERQTAVGQPSAPPTSDKVQMTVAEGWYSIGRDDAPVTLVEFADYQCPFCRRFHSETFVELKKNFIDTGKIRFVSRDLPLDFHPNALRASVASRCAGEQNKFWEMRDKMLVSDADLSPASLLKYGREINLDLTAFGACLSDKKYISAIQTDAADAGALGISGTPGFVVGKTAKGHIKGIRIMGALPYLAFETAINNQLSSAP